jgi:predicted lipid-binding transport protein (Tim44 family)
MGMLLGILAVFAVAAQPQNQATQEQKAEPQSQAAPSSPSGMMGGGMMSGGMMGRDASTMAEMAAIHELMVNHDRINRTVTNLTDGIRAVTESDDLQIAKTIQEHVLTMNRRVSAGDDPGLPMESSALHSIFRNADKVQTSIQTTAKGVVVVQTSTDPETVAALQQHASEVTDLVKGGMAAMQAAMMKSGMHGGMMGGMMGNAPKSETPAQPAVPEQPASQSHDQHHADVNSRGAQVMGFDQEKTTHHFYLYSDGGAIDVAVNDAADKTNLDAIRSHLPHIAMLFSQGNFEAPMLVHDTNVPGTAEMGKLKDHITYRYAETPKGGRVNIITTDAQALAAVHAFLKFQIADHQTGDPAEVRKR